MNLNDINSRSTGCKFFDWDNNRGGRDGAGRILIRKVQLLEKGAPLREKLSKEDAERIDRLVSKVKGYLKDEITSAPQPAQRDDVEVVRWNKNGSPDEMAAFFNGICSSTEGATSIHARSPESSRPFLFILGNRNPKM